MRHDGWNVYWKGRVRFTGEGRQYLINVDEEAIIRSLLQRRCDLQKSTGDVSIDIIAQGQELVISQKQSRSLMLHVKYKENDND